MSYKDDILRRVGTGQQESTQSSDSGGSFKDSMLGKLGFQMAEPTNASNKPRISSEEMAALAKMQSDYGKYRAQRSKGISPQSWFKSAQSDYDARTKALEQLRKQKIGAEVSGIADQYNPFAPKRSEEERQQRIDNLTADIEREKRGQLDAREDLDYASKFRFEGRRDDPNFNRISAEGQRKFEKDRSEREAVTAGQRKALTNPTSLGSAFGTASFDLRTDKSYKEPTEQWTQDQRALYSYLYAQDPEEADAYAQQVNDAYSINKRLPDEAKVSAWAEKHPVLATAGSIAAGPVKGGEFLADIIEYAHRGTVTQKDYVGVADASRTATGTISQNLNEKYGTLDEDLAIIGGKGWGDAYQLGESILSSMTYGHALGAAGTSAVFFGSAAKDGFDEAMKMGVDPKTALYSGFAQGTAEALFEYLSIDKLINLGPATSIKGYITNIFAQAGIEASEEMTTSIANTITDGIIMADKSQINMAIDAYMAEGMSFEEAQKKAYMDNLQDIAFDALGGAISGGISGGLETGVQNTIDKFSPYEGDTTNLMQTAEEASKQTGNDKLMEIARKQIENKKRVTNRNVDIFEKALRNNDIDLIARAAENRLNELGEAGDTTLIARAAAKQIAGERLSEAEEAALANSKYGERLSNELNPQNVLARPTNDAIKSINPNTPRMEEYSTQWAERIGTSRVNRNAYNLARIQEEHNNAVAAARGIETANREETHVSDSGKTIITSTGETVDIVRIKGIGNGTLQFELSNGQTVSSNDISYSSENEAVLYETVARMGVDAETANQIIKGFKPDGDLTAEAYVRGFQEAFHFGQDNISEDELIARGVFAQKLSAYQRRTAYKLGQRFAGRQVGKDMKSTPKTRGETSDKGIFQKSLKDMTEDELDTATKDMTDIQKESIKALHKLGQAIGVDFYFFASYKEADGKYYYKNSAGEVKSAENGFYEMGNGSIHIDINAGTNGEGVILYTAAHELTHFIREWSADKFKVLANFLIKQYGERGISVNDMILKTMRQEGVSRPVATEEVVAKSMESMLKDGSIIEFMSELHEADVSLWQKIKDFFHSLWEKINSLYKEYDPYTVEGRYVAQMKDAMEKFKELYTEGLEAASENFSKVEMEAVEQLGPDARVETNAEGELLMAENAEGTTKVYSGRTYNEGGREAMVKALKENGHSDSEIEEVTDYVDDILSYLKNLTEQHQGEYGYQQLADNLQATIVTNIKTGRQVLSTLVSNGDYPVNLDLTLTCKKRVAYMKVMNRLIQDGVFDNVIYDGEAIAKVNEILREAEYETACLGCFVESRRLQFQNWADTIVSEWNDEVKKRNPNAPAFNFASADVKFKGEDTFALTRELEGAGKKNAKGNLNLGTGNVKTKMGRLLDKLPSMQRTLTTSDLLNPEGLKKLRAFDTNLFSIVQQRYGAASPKIVQEFNPYASEIALMSFSAVKNYTGHTIKGAAAFKTSAKEKLIAEGKDVTAPSKAEFNRMVEREAIREYLFSIGGARMQSFSDFMISNTFDYFQMFADLAARRYPMHGYTKEAVCLRLFGMTGAKWNGSLIAHVEKSLGKEYAGLMPVGSPNTITVTVDGKKYGIGFDDYARHAMTKGTTKESFIQSIGMKDIIALQLDPRYADNVGSITIGVSDKQILAMLDSDYFRMVIPYHSSGMLPIFAKLVGVDNYNDYSDYQETKIGQYYAKDKKTKLDKLKGKADMHYDFNEAVQRLGDAKAAADEYIAWCNKLHPVISDKKVVGYVTFKPKFSDSPYHTDFTKHPKYYKLLEDFNSYNNLTQQSALQKSVEMRFPSEQNALSGAALEKYKSDLRETGIFTEKDVEKYAKKAQMSVKEIIQSELNVRKAYGDQQAPKFEGTIKKIEDTLSERPKVKLSARDSEGNELSSEQQEFFKDSKVRGEDGNLTVMYHGSKSVGFNTFDRQKSDDGLSFFFTDSINNAASYSGTWDTYAPKRENSDVVSGNYPSNYAVYLNIKNPLIIDTGGERWESVSFTPKELAEIDHDIEQLKATKSPQIAINRKLYERNEYYQQHTETPTNGKWSTRQIANYAHDQGYDGVMFKNLRDYGGELDMWIDDIPATVAIAFDSNQIKSISNKTPTSDPDIRYSAREDEQKINALREEIATLEDNLDMPFDPETGEDFTAADHTRMENRLTKLYHELDNLTGKERKVAVKTSINDLLANLSQYRRSDLESLAEQVSDGNWDDYEEMPRPDLEEALRGILEERAEDMTVLERQVPKFGYSVRPVESDIRYSTREEDKKYTRRATLEESTIDKYLDDYAAKSSPNYAQAYIAYISPGSFLDLTTSTLSRFRIYDEAKPLDEEKFKSASRHQPLQLIINHETGEVEGHEGRHRCVALRAEGIQSVPVLLFDYSNKNSKERIDSLILKGQDFGSTKSHGLVDVKDLIPFNYANREEIVSQFSKLTSYEQLMTRNGWDAFRYSSRTDAQTIKRLEQQNIELEADVKALKELLNLQKKVTGGNIVSDSTIKLVAKRLMKKNNSGGDVSELAELLRANNEYLYSDEFTWDDFRENAKGIAAWLMYYEKRGKQREDQSQAILDFLKGRSVKLNETQKEEAKYAYGSYGDYVRQNRKFLRISDHARTTLDELWQELSEQFPNVFSSDTNDSSMAVKFADALQKADGNIITEESAYDADPLAAEQDIVLQVVDAFWNMSTLHTVADVKQNQIDKLKAKQSEQIKNLKEQQAAKTQKEINALKAKHNKKIMQLRQQISDLKEKHKAETKALRREYRREIIDKQETMKIEYRERTARAKEGRDRTAMRHKIIKVVKELNDYLLKSSSKKHVLEGMRASVAAALEVVNMDTVGAEERIAKLNAKLTAAKSDKERDQIMSTIANVASAGDKLKTRLEGLRTSYEKVKSEGGEGSAYDEVIAAKIDETIDAVGNTSIRDMSLPQLEKVYELYTMVLHSIREANKVFIEGQKREVEGMAMMTMLEEDKMERKRVFQTPFLQNAARWFYNNETPTYFFKMLDSPTMVELFDNIRGGEDTWARDITAAIDFFLSMMEKHNYKKWDFDKTYEFTTEGEEGKTFQLNLDQIMSLYAYSFRDQALEHLNKGGIVFNEDEEVIEKVHGIPVKYTHSDAHTYAISPELLNQIVSNLSEEQKTFARSMQQYLSTTMGEKGNEVSMQLYGVRLFKEENYWPLRVADQFLAKAKPPQKGERKLKNSGFTKPTVPKAGNPVVLTGFMSTWANHVNDMSMYHSFVLPLESFYRVYNYHTSDPEVPGSDKSVYASIQNAWGRGANQYIEELLKDLNGGAVSDPRETLAKKAVGKFKKAAVFASASVVIQQLSAIGRAFTLIDPKWFIGPKVDAQRHAALWAEVKKYAPVAIIKEMGYFDTNMGRSAEDFLTATGYDTLKEKAKAMVTDADYRDEVLSKAPALADEITWCAIWEACKREQKAKGYTGEKLLEASGKRFSQIVRETQVYDSVLSRSANMRSKSLFMNLATAFMAESTVSINMLQNALIQGKRGDKTYARRAIGGVTTSLILNSLLVSLIYAARDDDDDDTFLEKYTSRLVSEIVDGINPLTYYPFIKDIWSAAQGFDIERADMTLIKDLFDGLQNLVRTMDTDTRGMNEEELQAHRERLSENGWKVVDGLSSLVGLPEKNIRRDINGGISLIKTLTKDFTERDTTWGSLTDKVWDEVRRGIPIVGYMKPESKQEKLYKATIKGDTKYADRLRNSYASESAADSALKSGLRESDDRVWAAAEARVKGNLTEYKRLAKAIMADTGLSQDVVVKAIMTDVNKLRAGEAKPTESKPRVTGFYDMKDFFNSPKDRASVKADLVDAQIRNGKTEDEALKSVESSISSGVRERFFDDELTEVEVEKILVTFAGKDDEYVAERLANWKFSKQNPDLDWDNYKINDYVRLNGELSPQSYDKYLERLAECEGEDKNGDGKPDRYSRQRQVIPLIDSLPISAEAKDTLFLDQGWAKSSLSKTPWHR